MKNTRLISSSLIMVSGVLLVGFSCSRGTDVDSNTAQPTQDEQLANSSAIVRQDGLITTFPTADLPILDRVEVLNSLRNSSEGTTVHEAEFISNTSVAELYAQYKSTLERVGWTEQNPETQEVGSIKIMTGIFVRGNDTISIAIQTSAGTKKDLGVTTVLLKIEQVD